MVGIDRHAPFGVMTMPVGRHIPIPEMSDKQLTHMSIVSLVVGLFLEGIAWLPMPWLMRISFMAAGALCFLDAWLRIDEVLARKKGLRKRREKSG
jgi:hypothetical protein